MSELRIVEDWSDPETRGHTIPGARYTSKEFFEQEWEDVDQGMVAPRPGS